MDRQLLYKNELAAETDLLYTNRNTMVALAKLSSALFGTAGTINGLTVGPSSPPALTVSVAAGEIYQLASVDSTPYSSLPADTTDVILKQGISLAAQTLACAAPGTAGKSINYLIQATYQDVDTGAVVLPYYNPSNPDVPYSGPSNSGAAQATVRAGTVVVNAKAGTAATTGSQVTPTVDSGYIALAVVTVANGQSTITSSNITAIASAIPVLGLQPTVLNFGADPTGTVSSVAAFNAALAAYPDVLVPAGTYLLDDAVTIPLGKRLKGAGRRKTIIRMPSTFNASALGCFVFSGGEPGGEITDLTIIQDQPDSTTATVYPPCIYAQNTPRFSLRRMRLACVYVGIDMKGNTGGAVIEDLELSQLSIGIDLDGALDSVKISKLHMWPFGGAGSTQLTTNQRVSFTASYGIKSGRCDDLHISDSLLFSVIKAAYFYNSAGGYTFGSITGTDFDDRGGLNVVTDGRIQLAGCTFTVSKTDSWLVNMTGGTIAIDGTRFALSAVNASANAPIELSGGTLMLGSGCTLSGAAFDTQLVYANNATLKVDGALFSRASNTAYSTAMIRAISTKGHAIGCFASDVGTGSGKFIQIDSDVGFVVRANNLRGWTIGVPTASALANTMVDGNLGAGSNRDTFSGYFSSDATTTVKLPSGWTVSRAAAGTYNVTHNLSLADAKDMLPSLTPDLTASGALAQWDIAASTTSVLRVRTYVGTVLTDCGVAFCLRRYRS